MSTRYDIDMKICMQAKFWTWKQNLSSDFDIDKNSASFRQFFAKMPNFRDMLKNRDTNVKIDI